MLISSLSTIENGEEVSGTMKPRGFWNDPENRKQYFEDFARAAGFDPHKLDNWRHVIPAQLHAVKVVS